MKSIKLLYKILAKKLFIEENNYYCHLFAYISLRPFIKTTIDYFWLLEITFKTIQKKAENTIIPAIWWYEIYTGN